MKRPNVYLSIEIWEELFGLAMNAERMGVGGWGTVGMVVDEGG